MAEVSLLRDAAEKAVEEHRESYARGIGTTYSDVMASTPTGKNADLEKVESQLEEINTSITELLDLEPEKTTSLEQKLHYNPEEDGLHSLRSSDLKIATGVGFLGLGTSLCVDPSLSIGLGSGLFCTAGTAYLINKEDLEPSYNPLTNTISISDKPMGEAESYKTVASELFHYYQHRESDTWSHPLFREGLERAVSIRELDSSGNSFHQDLYNSMRTHVLVDGYTAMKDLEGDLDSQDLYDLGLDFREIQSYADRAGDTESQMYNLGASLIMAKEEQISEEIYKQVFESDYSSFDNIEEITARLSVFRRLGTKVKGIF